MQHSLTEATASLHSILEPLSSEDRHRVVQAALMLLGDSSPALASKSAKLPLDEHGESPSGLQPQATAWMQKHKISMNLIEGFIHLDDGKATVIELPVAHASGREKTRVAYLMAGLGALLGNGDPSFSDSLARDLCRHFGCLDEGNHSTYVKALGNNVTGSKSVGWKLTAPGLIAVAELIKKAHVDD